MIEKLSKQQLKLISQYRKKYIEIGLDTTPFTMEQAKEMATWLDSKLKRTSKVIIMDGPYETFLCVLVLFLQKTVRKKTQEKVNYKFEKIVKKIYKATDKKIQPGKIKTILNKIANEKVNFVYPSLLGQFDVSFFAFYDFMKEVVGVKTFPDSYENLKKLIYFNLIYPIEGYIVFCQKPNLIHKNEKGLHCENGPALQYRDGTEIWALNGVRVPKEFVTTPASSMNPEIILKEKNAQVRRELVRKITIERLYQSIPCQILDKLGDYELINIKIDNNNLRPYLKMKNPSTGDIHIEGIHPQVRTVKEALAWRNELEIYVEPEILT